MVPDSNTFVARLENLVIRMLQDLQRYAQKEGASEIYVKKQNEIILELVGISNSLSSLKYLELWLDLEARMQALEEYDPNVNAHTILLHTRPAAKYNYSYININPFRP